MEAPRDLKSACVSEAIKIIEEVGLEKLSLREVARRLGVSHQAPYKHFESRDHVLAAVVADVFKQFARFLDDRPKNGEPWGDLRSLGVRYFEYAAAHPLHYRLMFSGGLPSVATFPEMMRQAEHAFSLLRQAIAALPRGERSVGEIDRDALFVWSTIHGLVSVMEADAPKTLDLETTDPAALISSTLDRIGSSLANR